MPSGTLATADRDFFTPLADVGFGNPFSAQRAEVIGRLVPNAQPGDQRALARVAESPKSPGAPG